ncbi:MAG: hypothetical protein P9M15_05185 [Candidatus Electryoneaceae bacterium]|nr:hypothetical protein [Candidatus Electryoneaceae bacterium]
MSLNRTVFATIISIILTISPSQSSAQMLDSLDRVMIDSALVLLNLTPEELGFDKSWVEDDTFRLAVVERVLSEPLSLPDYVDETTAAVDSFAHRPLEMLTFISHQLAIDPNRRPLKPPQLPDWTFSPEIPFQIWMDALEQAEPYRRAFYGELDSLDLHDLIMAAPTMWGDDDDSTSLERVGSWQREFNVSVDTSRDVDSDRLLDIMKKLDMDELLKSGMIVVPAAQLMSEGFAYLEWSEYPTMGAVDGVVGDVLMYQETEWGRFVVGGTGDNI